MYKVQEYVGGSGRWYICSCELRGQQGKWYFPARKLGMELTDWIELLHTQYHATRFKYDPTSDCLIYSFDNYNDAHKLVLWINRMARNGGW